MDILETREQRLRRFIREMNEGMAEASIQRCFNQGSDARIAGLPVTSSPYALSSREGQMWKYGWCDANEFWGADNRFARKLRKVKQPTENDNGRLL